MKKILIFLMSFVSIYSFGQTSLTDTSIVKATVSTNTFVGYINDYKYGILDEKEFLLDGTDVLICGILTCEDNSKWYEIGYGTKTYFIHKERLRTNFDYYTMIGSMSKDKARLFRNNAINKLYRSQEIIDSLNTLELRNYYKKTVAKGFAIFDWSFYDESEYTEGTSIKIQIMNFSKKTIKYLWFTFIGYNPVKDVVVDRNRGTNITMKGVGPIEQDEIGTYVFEYVWFTDLVTTAKISSIKIQYMDGTYKTITNPKDYIISNAFVEYIKTLSE